MKKISILFCFISSLAFAQSQWHALTNIPTNTNNRRFDDVFFLNDNLGWAANGSGASVYKTTDGGLNWNLQFAEQTEQLPGNYYFRNIEFLNENIGFLGTLNGEFFKTTNGGTDWELVSNFPTNPAAICGIDCVGNSTIYGCGAYFAPAYIIKSIDSGVNWQYIDMSAYAEALVEVLFVDENIGYAAGQSLSGGSILKTLDGGSSWSEIYNTNIQGEYVWKLQILASNPNVIFGSVESVAPMLGKFIRSLDNGLSWISKEVPDTDIQGVGFITENHGWMGGHSSNILETIDGGDNWTDIGIGSSLNRIFIINENLAYAAGTTVYKFEPALKTSNFTEVARIPLIASISPNPVKDKLIVNIEFTESDHLRLELYDALGHRITELKRDNIVGASKKTYSFDFPYPSGLYIVNLHTNTGRQSMKFIK